MAIFSPAQHAHTHTHTVWSGSNALNEQHQTVWISKGFHTNTPHTSVTVQTEFKGFTHGGRSQKAERKKSHNNLHS